MFDYSNIFKDSLVGLFSISVAVVLLALLVRKISPTKVSTQSLMTTLADFALTKLAQLCENVMGRNLTRKHGGFVIFLFFAVLALNLVGLIPGMPAPSTNPLIVLALALLSFFYFNYYGIKENGLGYFKHMASPLIDMGFSFKVIACFVFFFELVSLLLRIVSLTLRLVIAISVDHKLLEVFVTSDFGLLFGFIPVAAVFYFIGLFVSFIQAYVFFFLNAIYVYLAEHAHDDH